MEQPYSVKIIPIYSEQGKEKINSFNEQFDYFLLLENKQCKLPEGSTYVPDHSAAQIKVVHTHQTSFPFILFTVFKETPRLKIYTICPKY